MELRLYRPLLFFSLKSTGWNVTTDSIIELSFVKVFPYGEERIKTWRLKPWDYEYREQKPITHRAQVMHGIYDEELRGCPRFCDVVEEVLDWLKNSDLAGFGLLEFDLPLLSEEIERLRYYTKDYLETHHNCNPETNDKFLHLQHIIDNVNIHDVKTVDVEGIYHQMEPRNLKSAYRFYCGSEDFENAYSAEANTIATYKVLKGELDRYPAHLRNDVDFLANFSTKNRYIDYACCLAWNDANEAVITFGKHKGKTAREVYASEPSYFAWIKNGEFTFDTKRQFEALKEQFEQEKHGQRLSLDNTKTSEKSMHMLLSDEEVAEAARSLAAKFGL